MILFFSWSSPIDRRKRTKAERKSDEVARMLVGVIAADATRKIED